MTAPLFIAMPGNEAMTARLAALCQGEVGILETRNFPDGESYLRFAIDVAARNVVFVCTLARPNEKLIPLLFAAAAARDLGARRVGLVAPYLCYMRQDRRFRSGEAVTSRSFAALISSSVDWLATVDPHLHRIKSLDEIYAIPARALHAGKAIAGWIKAHVDHPFLIGPDGESEQWVGAVAQACGAGFAALRKQRLGDRSIRTWPDNLPIPADATPVLLDDIVSSGETMLAALRLVRGASPVPPVAIAIHGLFADEAQQAIGKLAAMLVTTNSLPIAAGAIDIGPLIAAGISDWIR